MIILTDIDGVCANFVQAFTENAYNRTGIEVDKVIHYDIFNHYPPRTHDELNYMVASPGFCYNIPVLDGAVEGIRALQQLGEVYAVTSPWKSDTWMVERQEWVIKHLNIPANNIIHTHAKHLIRGDILIEDRIENLSSWHKAWPQGTPILLNQSYNAHMDTPAGILRAYSWENILSTLRVTIAKQMRGPSDFKC